MPQKARRGGKKLAPRTRGTREAGKRLPHGHQLHIEAVQFNDKLGRITLGNTKFAESRDFYNRAIGHLQALAKAVPRKKSMPTIFIGRLSL